MELGRRWGTRTDASAAIVALRLVSSAMRSSDDSDWHVQSSMLSFHDFRGTYG